MKFGLIFFSSGNAGSERDAYRLVVESAKFADAHDFSSVWIPERHFTTDGWLYPNPAVLHAALSRETTRIQLRAGSVVLPLHSPLRVAEEWAMVDRLSHGRVGLSFASGWHPGDFALAPEKYADRNEEMYRGIETVQRLWRGEAVKVRGGDGREVEVRTYPTPMQETLPVWVTAAGSPRTFSRAGEIGANLLTHLFNQDVDELAEKIALYRRALAEHGYDPDSRQVSLMLHTFVGAEGDAQVAEQVRSSFCDYLKSASYLLNAIASSRGQKADFTQMSARDLDDYMNFIFDRLVSNGRVLFGTPEATSKLVARLAAVGVDEVACQIDFGMEADVVLKHLPHLDELRRLCRSEDCGRKARPAPATSGAHVSHVVDDTTGAQDSLAEIRARCTEEVEAAEFYRDLRGRGTGLRAIRRLWRGDGEALARVQLPDALNSEADAYRIHPALLDACFQALLATLPAGPHARDAEGLYFMTGVRRFKVHGRLEGTAWSHAVLRADGGEGGEAFTGDVRLLGAAGEVFAEALGLRVRRAEGVLPRAERRPEPAGVNTFGAPAPVRADILAAAPEERPRLLESYVREQVARVLRLSPSKLDVDQSLNSLGIDSLMAVELKKRVESDLGLAMRVVVFLQDPTVAQLTALALEQLTAEAPAVAAPTPGVTRESAEALLARIDELSSTEVDALLGSMLIEGGDNQLVQ